MESVADILECLVSARDALDRAALAQPNPPADAAYHLERARAQVLVGINRCEDQLGSECVGLTLAGIESLGITPED